ncbi:hypothetical protein QR98_0002520 [Sarcoptes scabiei]|uniref:Uncharacterized protein n=1 Tax=Sarcoptes scabiei TaxID=52283 RepID=A0A131ZTH9_SARSC|nr:hypothetical protein QR98_0002520 [Sarcoptes scabiei]
MGIIITLILVYVICKFSKPRTIPVIQLSQLTRRTLMDTLNTTEIDHLSPPMPMDVEK